MAVTSPPIGLLLALFSSFDVAGNARMELQLEPGRTATADYWPGAAAKPVLQEGGVEARPLAGADHCFELESDLLDEAVAATSGADNG